ncbi:MAG: leucine-rich repeat domain-containing protein, partial [Clostridia bacterium]|nr:leucine-rich repeat domain-containing protein [Clostridia bacterium]
MKNHFKRLLSLMLVVIMLVPMISATGLTVTAATYSGTCGYNLTWSFNDTTGVLKIEGTGDMYNYSYESYNSSYRTTAPWKTYISYIKSVVISDSVTSIGNRAFSDCTSLTSVTIGNSVTSIGDIVFADCTSLTSVTIPDSVTSIGSSAFSSCTSLTSVTIPDSVTSIDDSAFYNCTSLTSVTIPDSV